jgi:hypothetical protein
MQKNEIKYKEYLILNKENSIEFKGKVVKIKAIKIPTTFKERLFLFFKLYSCLNHYYLYFWCPSKLDLSYANYALLGKNSRSKYSNIWLELTGSELLELWSKKDMDFMSSEKMINYVVYSSNLKRVKFKDFKDYLDTFLFEK